MGDFGIRISKDGKNVLDPPTEATKKDFVFLSESNTPKVFYSGFLEEAIPFGGVSYEHNLGYVPMFFLFEVDSVSNPTFFRSADMAGGSTTTTITGQLISYAYLIILQEGS